MKDSLSRIPNLSHRDNKDSIYPFLVSDVKQDQFAYTDKFSAGSLRGDLNINSRLPADRFRL